MDAMGTAIRGDVEALTHGVSCLCQLHVNRRKQSDRRGPFRRQRLWRGPACICASRGAFGTPSQRSRSGPRTRPQQTGAARHLRRCPHGTISLARLRPTSTRLTLYQVSSRGGALHGLPSYNAGGSNRLSRDGRPTNAIRWRDQLFRRSPTDHALDGRNSAYLIVAAASPRTQRTTTPCTIRVAGAVP